MTKILTFVVVLSVVLTSNFSQAEQIAFECKTEKHLIKVLKLSNGFFEYKAWNVPANENNKPDVAISQKDAASMEGTGPCATRYYKFKKNDVEYLLGDGVRCVEGKPPKDAKGELTVRIKDQVKAHFWCIR